MAIVRPGKERHEVVALVANRDYGLKARPAPDRRSTCRSGVENKFGAGSVYKVFTAAAALEKGMRHRERDGHAAVVHVQGVQGRRRESARAPASRTPAGTA